MVYLFLADGFEITEALCPADLLLRAGLSVTTVSITKEREVRSSQGFVIVADACLQDLDFADASLLMLPGGMPGTKNLASCDRLCELLTQKAKQGIFLAAICAAPSVLGGLGLLKGKKAVCYPGFESELTGAILSDQKVVRDGKILTAAGMGVAFPFGLAAVEMLSDSQTADHVRRSVIG